ncbi:unnamed protein product [Rhizoctonia solani]|uniref:Uncharacterized protein n=1 Tax=Rhizoctonia solani TaxID=456999 RepID=A0A8H2WRH6_9AGAM|nr:unnamed protein product [Rhizoctonia solani]CAE6506143.1 unnamed protein product [Rhizoctonia solani]
MSISRAGSIYPSFSVRCGKFAYPLQAVRQRKKRCLEASRKEHVIHACHVELGAYRIRQYISADGMLYFGHGQFLCPDNLTNPVVFSAFLIVLRDLSQHLTAQNAQFGRFEVVIALQCVSPKEPRFSYYFVDHYLRRISDESSLMGDIIDSNHGAALWNLLDPNYWEHVALFSAHRPCTSADYDLTLGLLQKLQSREAVASLDTGDDDTPSDFEALRNLLANFDRTNIDKHATASIAKIMKRILPPPLIPKPRNTTSLGSAILRSLRGIILSGNPREAQNHSGINENSEDEAHPTIHEDPLEGVPLPTRPSSRDPEGGLKLRIG